MRVLIATDGSECASRAVALTGGLTWPSQTEITVLRVIPSGIHVFGGPWPPLDPVDTTVIDEEIRERAASDLEVATARLAGPGRTVTTVATTGRAADAIISYAAASAADIVILGSRGHGTLETMLLGSVSAEVLDRAHVPVLIARGPSFERVVLAWDGSECAAAAIPVLTEWGLFSGARVDVLSVADVSQPWWARAGLMGDATAEAAYQAAAEPSRQQHEEMARATARQLASAGLTAVPASRDGDPAEVIVAFATAKAADLVVLGTHGRTGLRRLLLGSVARNVVVHAPCSVLVAR